MNTPTHVLLNLVLLRGVQEVRGRSAGAEEAARVPSAPVIWGALLPDLPMVGFWILETLGRGRSQHEIWSALYFDPAWQRLFDAFNSVPVYAAAGVAALGFRWRAGQWLAASALLHIATDLPLHREDAHAHFWPVTNWHFVSSVSYWDPAHHGTLVSAIELALLAGCAWWLARRTPVRWLRAALCAVVVGAALGWGLLSL